MNFTFIEDVTNYTRKLLSRESSSSRSGDPVFAVRFLRAGSPLREDDDSQINFDYQINAIFLSLINAAENGSEKS